MPLRISIRVRARNAVFEDAPLFELTHMKRGQLAAFSQRTAQIERRLASEGLTAATATAAQMQRVKLATRPPKMISADRQALFAEWKERARDVEIDFTRRGWPLEAGGLPRRSTVPDPAAHAAAEGARRSVKFAIAHLTERQANIGERDLLDVALKHGVGRATLLDVRREIERLSSSGYLVPESALYRWPDAPLDAPAYPRDLWVAAHVQRGLTHQEARARFDLDVESGRLVPVERRYTTQTALERERRILHVERTGRDALQPIAAPEAVHVRLSSSRLSPGQRAAVELIATAPHRVLGVQGYAGTGKSKMLDQARVVAEEHDYRVVAAARELHRDRRSHGALAHAALPHRQDDTARVGCQRVDEVAQGGKRRERGDLAAGGTARDGRLDLAQRREAYERVRSQRQRRSREALQRHRNA
jgi:AAA domain/TrwC relaxase